MCERHNNMLAICWRQIELVSILVKFFLAFCGVSHTRQLLPNTSWPTICLPRVKTAEIFLWVNLLEC